MKKKLSIVLAVVLTVILLLTCVTSSVYGWNLGTKVEKVLPMEHCGLSADKGCGPLSGVSIGQYYREVIDRDGDGVVSEDFEWGSNGTSLGVEPPFGGVDWTVKKTGWWGNSVAEIDTDPDHIHTGTGSARFYHDGGYNYMLAYYLQTTPTYRSFYFKKDDDAVLYTITGYGSHRIFVRVINSNDKLQYYDGKWITVCDLNNYPTEDGWHFIEFKNIDWTHATYDIHFNERGAIGATMDEDSGYDGKTMYYNYNPCGTGSECWIDDILDTKGDYPNLPHEDKMLDRLLDCMKTSETTGTKPIDYGPGFVKMTQEYGYYNFDDDYDYNVTDEDWDYIKDAIEHGWPVALRGGFGKVGASSKDGSEPWPPKKGHYIAIRGYGYYELTVAGWTVTYGHYIICTDSYSNSNELVLSWDNLIDNGDDLIAITIRDN